MKPIKPLLLSLVGIGIIGWVGYSFYQAYQPHPVKLQGQIDAQQYSISSKVPGRIDEIFVRKGELIFSLLSPEIDAKLEQAKAGQKALMAAGAVAEVEAYAKDTQIHSWFNGEVSQVLLSSGELAPQGFPVVTVIDTNDAWAVLNVREDMLKHFEKGSQFEAYLPALDKSLTFQVTHIAVMGDFATWRSTDAAQGFDLRTFEVEAHPVETSETLRMGMSLVVEL